MGAQSTITTEPAAAIQQQQQHKQRKQQQQNTTKEEREITWDEVTLHNRDDDCWLVIDGGVYDVTRWVEKHPGGRVILTGAGRESTAMFRSYHPPSVSAQLSSYRIGRVTPYEPYYNFDESPFYNVLQRRVHAHIRTKASLQWAVAGLYLKTSVLLVGWLVAYYYGMWKGSLLATVVLGFLHAHLGISMGHDGCHGSLPTPFLNQLGRWLMDLMGGSALVWWMQHNIGHHPNSNRQGTRPSDAEGPAGLDLFDPDVRSGSPIMRFNPEQPWRPIHRFQHLYIWVLFVFVGARWYVNDIKTLSRGRYHSLDFFALTRYDVIRVIFTKLFFLVYAMGIPLYLHGLWALPLMAILFTMTSYVFCLVFATNHLTETALFPNENQKERDWATLQVLTAANYGTDSMFWTTLSGGLNYQIEHHLFPGLCHVYLPHISPIVRDTCKEFNVHYQCYDNYFTAIGGYINHLKQQGQKPTVVKKQQ